jgi:hypothetical protein
MKQGSAFPYISYAVARRTRIGFSLMTHCICHERGTRINAVPGSTPNTKDKGIIFKPNKSNKIDCHVDSDFSGLFAVEDGLKPICARSQTGYVIKYCDVPILWVSKIQTQNALSTIEAEYIALSQSMRDLIPIREILREIMLKVLNEKFKPECTTHSKAFMDATPSPNEIIPQSEVFEDNAACMKFAQMPKLSPRTKYLGVPLHW